MVDLVKIRKKAKEQKSGDSPSRPPAENEDASTAAAESRKPSKEKKRASTKKGSPGRSKGSKKTTSKASKEAEARAAAEPDEQTGPVAEPSTDESTVEVPPVPESAMPAGTDSTDEKESRLSEFKRTAGVMESTEEEVVEEEAEAGEDQLELITFVLAGEQYAMEVDQLVEIIVPRRWTRVPNADETVIGIISLRGSIVTLIDLRRLLGHPGRSEETEDTRIIVVRNESEQVGFIVDRVLRVVKVDEGSIEPHPVVSSSEQNEAVKGVFVSGDTITIYLDLERITV